MLKLFAMMIELSLLLKVRDIFRFFATSNVVVSKVLIHLGLLKQSLKNKEKRG